MSKVPNFTKETRPVKCNLLTKQMCVWFSLKCHPDEFDTEVCCSILSKYWLNVKKLQKPSEDALSDKQYNLLHNIYHKFRVKNIFDWEQVKFICVDISEFGELIVKSKSGVVCKDYYYETKNGDVFTKDDFVKKYGSHIKHPNYIMQLSQSNDDDYD